MNDRDELREIWQSQPVEKGEQFVPTFSLIEDVTVPFYMPLSRGRRIGYAFGFVWTAWFVWRHGGAGWPHSVGAGTSVAVALAGLGLLVRSRDRSRDPQPEETVSSYRNAIASEFSRQFRIEKLIVILQFGGLIAGSVLELIGNLLVGGSADSGVVAGIVFGVAALSVGMRFTVRAANSVLSRLSDH